MDESDWDPMPSATARRERVPVRIEVSEVKLREKVKAAGGRWDPEKRVWHLPMEQVLQLGLTGRVAAPAGRHRATRPADSRKELSTRRYVQDAQ